ncbi:hypothetical protein LTR35_002996 [Friedmanniomyces endolithicus]|uniref:Uncharacterized protein n=1 Tax=Friedmanniomyces endolithicus TaxID=329885 RepID=A0AAN6F5P2_9PEZI|nr:hypothetical protein LTS00_012358 [Friedmanniomyces endolithicus]KAK0289797.1 hypothetical protein LTR35_002996 [Friedmanniomyces endolithicus]KAK0305887.1 hypothetical protein LTR82_016608 [Friedmanniomyces endolithicus]KAK1019876.1 hypothetical protein LTR54_000520 [Friedmanniomyces endolithicus]
MASPSSPPVSNHRDVQKQQQQHSLQIQKGSVRKSAVSKDTPMSRESSIVSDADSDEEAEEADSSADEASDEEDSEPDESALSDVRAQLRLAGFASRDMFEDDTAQAVTGATMSDDDDGDYAGVEDLSDDEEDIGESNDLSVLRAAEQDLRDEFERTEQRRNADSMTDGMDTMFLQRDEAFARRLGLQVGQSQPDGLGFSVNLDDDPFVGLQFDDSLYQEMYDDAEKALGMGIGDEDQCNLQSREGSAGTKKRVRFQEPHETPSRQSSMSNSDDPNDLYPDLFDAQDDPALRQRFGLDVDLDANFRMDYSDAGSCYDFDGDEERMALAIDDEESDSDDPAGDFGAETEDEGDTTDEESDEERDARIKAIQKRAAEADKSAQSTTRPAERFASPRVDALSSPSTPKTGKGPRLGKFVIDKTKATISSDATGKKINIHPPQNPTEKDKAFWTRVNTVNAARGSTPRASTQYSMRTVAVENLPRRPFTAQSTLGSMFNGNLDILRNNDASGIAGDLFPDLVSRSNSFTETLAGDSESETEEVNMQDFIDMDSDESDSEEPTSASTFSSAAGPRDSFSSADTSRNDSLLNHLDQQRGLVGSFRRNQNLAKQVSSLASHPVKRASTLESNALQKGRRAAANIPITPARKKRVSQDLSLTGAGVRKAVGSPLAGRRPRSRGGSLSGLHQTLGPSLM